MASNEILLEIRSLTPPSAGPMGPMTSPAFYNVIAAPAPASVRRFAAPLGRG